MKVSPRTSISVRLLASVVDTSLARGVETDAVRLSVREGGAGDSDAVLPSSVFIIVPGQKYDDQSRNRVVRWAPGAACVCARYRVHGALHSIG